MRTVSDQVKYLKLIFLPNDAVKRQAKKVNEPPTMIQDSESNTVRMAHHDMDSDACLLKKKSVSVFSKPNPGSTNSILSFVRVKDKGAVNTEI